MVVRGKIHFNTTELDNVKALIRSDQYLLIEMNKSNYLSDKNSFTIFSSQALCQEKLMCAAMSRLPH